MYFNGNADAPAAADARCIGYPFTVHNIVFHQVRMPKLVTIQPIHDDKKYTTLSR